MLKNTFELKTGDIVLNHGMKIQLGAREEFINTGNKRECVAFDGIILNVEEVNEQRYVPFFLRCDKNKLGNEWTVQGNELAVWEVIG
jgi:hypothetical protein